MCLYCHSTNGIRCYFVKMFTLRMSERGSPQVKMVLIKAQRKLILISEKLLRKKYKYGFENTQIIIINSYLCIINIKIITCIANS